MSDSSIKPHPLVALRLNHKDAYDAASMLFYLILVYGWGLWIYPLGRDVHHLANLGADLPFLARQIFAIEVRMFGENPVGYHLVNLVSMYACMVLVYHFVNKTAKGLWWFGTLAACLFMANPVHSETMHNLSGVGDLVPCLAGLAALTAYAWNAATPSRFGIAISFVAAAFAAGFYAENAMIGAVLLAYELLAVRRESRKLIRGIVFFAMTVVVVLLAGTPRQSGPLDFAQMFGPLYLIFYPIGLLPKTVESFHENPWAAWLAVFAVAIGIRLIYGKAKRPELLFVVAGMLLLRLVPSGTPVDWVHMIGGGQLLLPNVLFVLGLIVLVYRIMDHPRWRMPMISVTTTLVIVFFAMQWRSIATWREAGAYVREFQAHAAKATERGEALGVLPDFQYYRGAPVCLSDAISYDTPFSTSLPHTALLPLHPESLVADRIEITSWSERGGEVVLPAAKGVSLFHVLPNASRISLNAETNLKDLWGPSMPEGTVTITRKDDAQFRATLHGDGWQTTLLPGIDAGKEPDSEAKSDADH